MRIVPLLLREVEELLVHRLVADAVHEQLRARPQRRLGLGQAGRVNDQRQVVFARLVAGGGRRRRRTPRPVSRADGRCTRP